jgi:hypothetical protein
MHQTLTTWDRFGHDWAGVHNFLMAGELLPFAYDFPPLVQLVDELRRHPEVAIHSGAKDRSLCLDDYREQFRQRPVAELLTEPFSLAHYHLSVFDAPGRCLHGFGERVLRPWQAALAAHGFTWDRCYPIIFISGPESATNYHLDFSHVLAWQIYGTKRFCGLREPDRWCPREMRLTYQPNRYGRPPALADADALAYDMPPGTALWNALLTPHWVESVAGAAMSVNISHGGLRLHGQLCRHEAELEEFRLRHPEVAPGRVTGRY